jgi:hypothetical protein
MNSLAQFFGAQQAYNAQPQFNSMPQSAKLLYHSSEGHRLNYQTQPMRNNSRLCDGNQPTYQSGSLNEQRASTSDVQTQYPPSSSSLPPPPPKQRSHVNPEGWKMHACAEREDERSNKNSSRPYDLSRPQDRRRPRHSDHPRANRREYVQERTYHEQSACSKQKLPGLKDIPGSHYPANTTSQESFICRVIYYAYK